MSYFCWFFGPGSEPSKGQKWAYILASKAKFKNHLGDPESILLRGYQLTRPIRPTMRPRISIRGSVRPSVGRSVGRSVGPSVTLLSKSRKINIFEQISDRGGILGSLYASLHLNKRVCPSVGRSVRPSVVLSVTCFFLNCKNEGFSSCMSSGRPRNITEM